MSFDFKNYMKPWKEEKFVQNVQEDSYHAEAAVSSGQIRKILDKKFGGIHKLHAEKTLGLKRADTPALRFGRLFHSAVLEGPDFLKRYRVMPKFTGLTKEGKESEQSKEAKTKRAAWLMDLPPRTIVVEDQEELDQVSGMMASMVKHPVARDLLNGGIRELSGFFNYEGFRCRIRIDLLQGDLLAVVDVKTALNATFEIFEKEIEKQFYYIQAWFYLIGTAKLLKKKGLQFKFIAVEKEPPYLVNVIPVGETLLSVADAHLQWALNKLKTAIETDVWLPNEQIEHVAQASDWMMNQCATEGN